MQYACRKTLADSRPRVRGRFAKNDELGDIGRNGCGNHEDDKDEEFSLFSTQIPADQQRKVCIWFNIMQPFFFLLLCVDHQILIGRKNISLQFQKTHVIMIRIVIIMVTYVPDEFTVLFFGFLGGCKRRR